MSSTGGQNEMQDYIEKALNAAFAAMKAAGKSTEGVDWQQIAQNAQKQWAAGGQGPMGKRQKEVVSMHARAVARNKRLAASLRQGSIGMPNIAAVMTGQIGGPVGQLGKMQKAISSPFQQMYNFQKEQEEFEKDKDKMDPDERRERESELKEQESQQNPIAKLLGKHVKRMGKFMESGTGQVLGGGLMAVGSIATMIIKKAIESSPMMQAMLN